MVFVGDVWFPFVCFFFLILSATLLQCYYDEVYNPIAEESAEEDAYSNEDAEAVPSTPQEKQFLADLHGTRLSPSVDRRPYLNDTTEIAGSGVSMPSTGETRHFTVDKSSVCLMFI